MKTFSFISSLFKKKNDTISYQKFYEIKEKIETMKESFSDDLFNALVDRDPQRNLVSKMFIDFIENPKYKDKDLATFKGYIYQTDIFKNRWIHSNLLKNIDEQMLTSIIKSIFEKYLTQYCSDFFVYRKKHQEYTFKIDDFINFVDKSSSWVLKGLTRNSIISIYNNELGKHLEREHKNPFWLDISFVDKHLSHMAKGNIGNGSFTYNWTDGKTNGIEKLIVEGKTYPYNTIEQLESNICEYLFGYRPEIAYTISHSKKLVEFWSGGSTKFHNNLQTFIRYQNFSQEIFFSDKHIKLADVAAEWFAVLKRQFNLIRDNLAEWIEGDMLDDKNSAYNSKNVFYFVFWGTIWNFSLKEIKTILKSMQSNDMLNSSYAMITHFEAPDKDNMSPEVYKDKQSYIKAAYWDPDIKNPYYSQESKEAFEDSILSWLEALGMPREALDYIVKYEEKTNIHPARILLGARADRNFTVHTQSGGRYSFSKDQEIWATQSIRFTPNEWKNILDECGFSEIIHQSSKEDKESIDLAVSVIKSKPGFFNDKFKRIRKGTYVLLIGTTLLWWGYSTKYFLERKEKQLQEQKIKDHEIQLTREKSLLYFDYLWGLRILADDLANQFIAFYGQGKLEKDDIQQAMVEYLKEYSDGQDFLIRINQDKTNNNLHMNFIHKFANTYFYKTMIHNGFESIDPLPILSGLEKEAIATLEYQWPVQEGYNEKDWYYYVIHDPLWLDPTTKDNTARYPMSVQIWSGPHMLSEDLSDYFVWWYIVPHACDTFTITVPEKFFNSRVIPSIKANSGISEILRKNWPDKEGNITFKKLVVWNVSSWKPAYNIYQTETKLLFFLDKTKPTHLWIHKNLSIDKNAITDYFERQDPFFYKIRDTFKKESWCERHYMWRSYYPSQFSTFKEKIILDLYKGKSSFIPKLDYTEYDINNYVKKFIESHKYELQQIQYN